MLLNHNLIKKNILLSLQILWEIAVAVGGKQMENALVYISYDMFRKSLLLSILSCEYGHRHLEEGKV